MSFANVTTAAVIGTTARPTDVAPPELIFQPDAMPAERLLDAAAGYAVAHTGVVPQGPGARWQPPDSTWQPVPDEISNLIYQVVRAGTQKVLRQTLQMVADRQLALSSDVIIAILRLSSANTFPTAHAAAILDGPALALAQLNSEWGQAVAWRTGSIWTSGTPTQRLSYFEAHRAADPAAGRQLLESLDWDNEGPQQRADFLARLAPQLSAADEALIAQSLTSRSGVVKREAERLLSLIRIEQYGAHAAEVLGDHLELTKDERGEVLAISETALVEALAARGIVLDRAPDDAKATKSGKTNRTSAARLAIAHVPTQRWPQLVGRSAPELAAIRTTLDGVEEDLAKHWADAARNSGDAVLAEALIRTKPDHSSHLLDLLPDSLQAELAELALNSAMKMHSVLFLDEFGPALSDAVLTHLEQHATDDPYRYARDLEDLALRFDLGTGNETAARLRAIADKESGERSGLTTQLRNAATAVELRQRIYQHLNPYPVRHRVVLPKE